MNRTPAFRSATVGFVVVSLALLTLHALLA